MHVQVHVYTCVHPLLVLDDGTSKRLLLGSIHCCKHSILHVGKARAENG